MALSATLKTASDWLDYIENLHSADIEFGLERVNAVFIRLFPEGLHCRVVTVGGTNGKGSTCALIERILLNAGYSCGKHTSPHISDFNERISINGNNSYDAQLIRAFQKVELQRKQTLLTYFEFTFLTALVVFQEEGVDFAICEVGMGGRLDAVNILSPEVSVITNVGLDHVQWLGETRAQIAVEKVAISRAQKPCIVGDYNFPENARQYLVEHDVVSFICGDDYVVEITQDNWQLTVKNTVAKKITSESGQMQALPKLSIDHEYQNASCAILAVLSLQNIEINHIDIKTALIHNHLPGRCQILQKKPYIIVDVAHNHDSVAALSQFVRSSSINLNNGCASRIVAVFSMLDDKDIYSSLNAIGQQVDEWHIAEMDVARAASLDKITAGIKASQANAKIFQYEELTSAFDEAKVNLKLEDCLLVFGSFFVVSDIIRHYQK